MKKQIEIHAADWQPGDVIVGHNGPVDLIVEREVPDPPKPKPKPGTRGTAFLGSARVPGMIDEDGDFVYLDWDGVELLREYEPIGRTGLDFVPDSDETPQPAKPQITRELFIRTLQQTAVDNNLDTGPGFDTAIVFAADRLGLY